MSTTVHLSFHTRLFTIAKVKVVPYSFGNIKVKLEFSCIHGTNESRVVQLHSIGCLSFDKNVYPCYYTLGTKGNWLSKFCHCRESKSGLTLARVLKPLHHRAHNSNRPPQITHALPGEYQCFVSTRGLSFRNEEHATTTPWRLRSKLTLIRDK